MGVYSRTAYSGVERPGAKKIGGSHRLPFSWPEAPPATAPNPCFGVCIHIHFLFVVRVNGGPSFSTRQQHPALSCCKKNLVCFYSPNQCFLLCKISSFATLHPTYFHQRLHHCNSVFLSNKYYSSSLACWYVVPHHQMQNGGFLCFCIFLCFVCGFVRKLVFCLVFFVSSL